MKYSKSLVAAAVAFGADPRPEKLSVLRRKIGDHDDKNKRAAQERARAKACGPARREAQLDDYLGEMSSELEAEEDAS